MNRLTRALEEWRRAIGEDYVITDRETLTQAETATFMTTQRVPAILQPANRAEVQACVRIANTYKVPLYPVSNGKNWGYGSQVPVQDDCVILHLQRMKHITAYNERLAYVTVEPGVTVRQLYHFLRERDSSLFVSVVGGPLDTSLIGNTLERGLGTGRYADRFGYVCDFEVVLPTGECIHTGYDRFPGAQAGPVSRWGVGPFFDGIFTQSNFGIVTRMTIWLLPIPRYFTVCLFTLKDDARLEDLIEALFVLKFEGACPASIYMYNDYKFLSMLLVQSPELSRQNNAFLSPEIMQSIRGALGFGAWSGLIALQYASKQLCDAMCAFIRDTLSDRVDTLRFFDGQTVEQVIGDAGSAGAIDLLTVRGSLDNINDAGGLRTTYWRKKVPPPSDMNPDRDHCGVIWCAPLVPLTGADVRAVKTIIDQVCFARGMEPHLSLECVTERSAIITIVLLYDRDVTGEDERAMACHDELLHRLTEAGYIPYRLGVQSMHGLPPVIDDSALLYQRIKDALDPNDILAPGRYDLRPQFAREYERM